MDTLSAFVSGNRNNNVSTRISRNFRPPPLRRIIREKTDDQQDNPGKHIQDSSWKFQRFPKQTYSFKESQPNPS